MSPPEAVAGRFGGQTEHSGPSSRGGSSNFTGTGSPSPAKVTSLESILLPCPRRSGSSAAAPSRQRSSTVTCGPSIQILARSLPPRTVRSERRAGDTLNATTLDARWLFLGTDADGIDRNKPIRWPLLGRVGRGAGVQSAVADNHHAGNGRVPAIADDSQASPRRVSLPPRTSCLPGWQLSSAFRRLSVRSLSLSGGWD